ncbi:helix-turn-helix domain-containing protein [Streptacidiphilus albus]|uniref:helix-turn-helix domain-containing protein n=1 Tax=Streptacidiphilus albus TaxID=105425 RepID=UPI00054C231B|nr:helix-turn-helix transcriptional regulator [Streptacidiphilus albus]
MPAGRKPTYRSKRLGALLKQYRIAAELDQDDAAAAIKGSTTKISRLESGHVSARPLEVDVLLTRYGIKDDLERARLEKLAMESTKRGWWLDFRSVKDGYAEVIALERDARRLCSWYPNGFPGAFQSDGYMERIITSGPKKLPAEEIAELIEVRRQRRTRIVDSGVQLSVVVWAPAITGLFDDNATDDAHPDVHQTHQEQLEHVLTMCEAENVSLQVLPEHAVVLAGMSAQFTAYTFDAAADFEAVTIEGLTTCQVIEEAEDLSSYMNLFDALRSAALPPDASVRFIRETLEGTGSHGHP